MSRVSRTPGISRRRFLRLGLGFGLGCACGWLAPAPLWAGKNYYAENKASILADFADTCLGVRALLAPRLGDKHAVDICALAKDQFAKIVPDLPDVGGAANRNQPFIVQAAELAALHLALAPRGLSGRDAGRLYYDLNAGALAAAPVTQLRAQGAALFTSESRRKLEAWALETQKRKYPGDWVATYVPGDGKTFDLGYDYAECGALKLFRALDAAEAAPYFCINDFLASKAMGTGLFRKGTLAGGADRCDFRYKLDGPVSQDWETEAPSRFV